MRYLGLAVVFLLLGCGGGSSSSPGSSWQPSPLIYQLQNMNPDQMASSGTEILITDYSQDGTDQGQYTTAQIAQIKNTGTTVLCYLSVGEAEDYRFYWDASWESSPPSWLGAENPEWAGNYKVKYWESGWFDTVLTPYLDRLTGMGCSGAYLDIIDAFEYWPNVAGSAVYEDEAAAAHLMIGLVERVAAYARAIDPAFLIYPQNGEWILDYDDNGSYQAAVSGIGIEDLFYHEADPYDSSWSTGRSAYLDTLKNAGKTILITDYVDDGSGYAGVNKTRIDDFLTRIQAKGYWGFAARSDRELDRGTGYGVKP